MDRIFFTILVASGGELGFIGRVEGLIEVLTGA
jgi:hypothetical protein